MTNHEAVRGRDGYIALRNIVRTQCPDIKKHKLAQLTRAAIESELVLFTLDGQIRFIVDNKF